MLKLASKHFLKVAMEYSIETAYTRLATCIVYYSAYTESGICNIHDSKSVPIRDSV